MTDSDSPRDIAVELADHPGALADLGERLGAAGVSLEGGAVFTHSGTAIAHFLVEDADRARSALERFGIGPVTISDVVTVRLAQEVPGQLGAFTRAVAEAAINILVQYSDHDHRLVLVVAPQDRSACQRIADHWDAETATSHAMPGSGPSSADCIP